jgi:hypothetical protein
VRARKARTHWSWACSYSSSTSARCRRPWSVPANAWTPALLAQALKAGFELATANGLAIRDGERFCWCLGVPLVYLDGVNHAIFEGELPVIGLFPDYDVALHGTDWVTQSLDRGLAAGVRRLSDFRELAALLNLRMRLEGDSASWRLNVEHVSGLPAPRRVEVMLRFPGPAPRHVTAVTPEGAYPVRVQQLDAGLARTVLPAAGRELRSGAGTRE